MRKLLILGAGQYGCVAQEVARAMGVFEQIDFLDDVAPAAIGRIAECERYLEFYDCAFVAVGNPQFRLSLLQRMEGKIGFATLISPLSYVSPSANVSSACIIEPMAVLHANATLAKGCILSAGAVVNHNASLGEGCHVDCHGTVAARACVPAYTKVPAGSVFDIQI